MLHDKTESILFDPLSIFTCKDTYKSLDGVPVDSAIQCFMEFIREYRLRSACAARPAAQADMGRYRLRMCCTLFPQRMLKSINS